MVLHFTVSELPFSSYMYLLQSVLPMSKHLLNQYATHAKDTELEMWANAQRDGRLAEYRWRHLFNAAVWLCSNAAKTRNPLKLVGCPKLTKRSQPLVGRSSPYCKDMWG